MWARRLVVLGIVAMVLLLAACGGSQPATTDAPAAPDGDALLQERCTGCHGVDRVTGMQATRAEWNDIVTRMVNKGAKLSTDEVTALVDYLAATYGE
jgi:cytochrome c5